MSTRTAFPLVMSAAALVAVTAISSARAKPMVRPEVRWGEAQDGVRLGFAFAAAPQMPAPDTAAPKFRSGEKLQLDLYVRNDGPAPRRFHVQAIGAWSAVLSAGNRLKLDQQYGEGVESLLLQAGEVRRFPGKPAVFRVHDPAEVLTIGEPALHLSPGKYRFQPVLTRIQPQVHQPEDGDPVRAQPSEMSFEVLPSPPGKSRQPAPSLREERGAPAWGEAVGGLQAGLAWAGTVPDSVRVGDPVVLEFRVRNVSAHPVPFQRLHLPAQFQQDFYAPPAVFDREGKQVADLARKFYGYATIERHTLLPGESVVVGRPVFHLVSQPSPSLSEHVSAREWVAPKPGRYVMSHGGEVMPMPAWSFHLRLQTGKLPLTIRE